MDIEKHPEVAEISPAQKPELGNGITKIERDERDDCVTILLDPKHEGASQAFEILHSAKARWDSELLEANEAVERKRLFRPLSDLEGRAVPELQWLVPNWIPMGQPTMLSGDGGTGKSLIAAQLVGAVGMGETWLGQTVRSGTAFYLSAEDDEDELHRRFSAIANDMGTEPHLLRGVERRSLAGEDALLATLTRAGSLVPTDLFRLIEEEAMDRRPEVIVLDTLADFFPGNENDRAQARAFIGLLRGLATRSGAAVTLLSHPSLSGMSSGTGQSGSTAWNNSVRSRLYFERVRAADGHEDDVDVRRLSRKKSNYAATGETLDVRWSKGVFVPEAAPTGIDRMAGNMKADRVFLMLMALYRDQGRNLNPSSGANYAPSQFASHADSEGITKQAFKSAMDRLLSQKKVEIVKVGSASRTTQQLVLRGEN